MRLLRKPLPFLWLALYIQSIKTGMVVRLLAAYFCSKLPTISASKSADFLRGRRMRGERDGCDDGDDDFKTIATLFFIVTTVTIVTRPVQSASK